MELLRSPFEPHFRRLLDTGETRLLICTPYLSREPVSALIRQSAARGAQRMLDVRVITDISARNLLSGATDLDALVDLTQAVQQATVVYVPKVHAKVYVAGQALAIITSANFTDSGARSNLEYGVAISDASVVRRVSTDIDRYAALGGIVPAAALTRLASRARDLRAAMQAAQASVNAQLRRVASSLQRETEDDLIRLHMAGRSPHALFAQTVLYLLSLRPMTTPDLHDQIRVLHPDLCDDSTDRVIDGQHFGKLWKHQVRTAQQHLKRKGAVAYDPETRCWMLT